MTFPSNTVEGYVIAVIVVMVVIVGVAHWMGSNREREIIHYFAGFLLGMLAMYIAVHVYPY